MTWEESSPTSSSWNSTSRFSRLLQEDGSFLLQETSYYILLENLYDWSLYSEGNGSFVETIATPTVWS